MKKQDNIKPVKAWAIGVELDDGTYIIPNSVRKRRDDAIVNFTDGANFWLKYKKVGYRCIPVEIRAVTK